MNSSAEHKQRSMFPTRLKSLNEGVNVGSITQFILALFSQESERSHLKMLLEYQHWETHVSEWMVCTGR